MKATNDRIALEGLILVIVILFVFSFFCPNSSAQSRQTFTSADKFAIPELNGSVSFAVNGSYSSATLENGTWVFKDLIANNSQLSGNLKISADNSNVIIQSYRAFNSSFRSSRLYYTVDGVGKQTVNFGFSSSQPTSVSEWSVNLDGRNLVSEGKGWTLRRDNTVVITGAAQNATVNHYVFNVPSFNDSNLPFYQKHSVAIATFLAIVVTVVIAVVIKVKVRS